jgi:hypothetical protein
VVAHSSFFSFLIFLTYNLNPPSIYAFGDQEPFWKPHCVGVRLQCKDGVQCFKGCIVSMDIPLYRTVSAWTSQNFLLGFVWGQFSSRSFAFLAAKKKFTVNSG